MVMADLESQMTGIVILINSAKQSAAKLDAINSHNDSVQNSISKLRGPVVEELERLYSLYELVHQYLQNYVGT
jgi:hypothetical protein